MFTTHPNPHPQGARPEIVMPPLSPPPQCLHLMETRADDTEEVVKRRLQVGVLGWAGSG